MHGVPSMQRKVARVGVLSSQIGGNASVGHREMASGGAWSNCSPWHALHEPAVSARRTPSPIRPEVGNEVKRPRRQQHIV